MKKVFAILLGLAFATGAAEAKTYYVNAARPNNNGNGLQASTAKKTIQAAINIAKDGDTILVQPGKYPRIRTNNKRIIIKSVEGHRYTAILSGEDKTAEGLIVADLAAWSKNVTARHRWWGETWTCCWKIKGYSATTIQGFKIRPTSFNNSAGELWYFESAAAIAGGTAKNCSFEHCGGVWRYLAFESSGKLECTAAWPTFLKAKLGACKIVDCVGMGEWYKKQGGTTAATPSSGILADSSLFNRCIIKQSGSSFSSTRNGGLPETCNFLKSKFANCLFIRNWRPWFNTCMIGNCTVAGNYGTKLSGCTAFNTVFSGVSTSQFTVAKKNRVNQCHLAGTPGFVRSPISRSWTADDEGAFVGYADESWYWDRTLRLWMLKDTENADYHLRQGSPCINKGALTAPRKKLVGSYDLAGKKRVFGKSIDMGCYEY